MTPQEWFDRLTAMMRQPTRRRWQDRLPRPSTIGTSGAGVGVSRYLTPRHELLDTLWSYNIGDPPLPQVEPEYHDIFRDVLRKARSNYAAMCIQAMADRMEQQAVSTQLDSDTDGDDIAAQIMDETGFAAVFKDIQGFAFAMGEGYSMVVPGTGDVELSTGAPCPSIHAIDPRRCIGIPDPANPIRLRAALVTEFDPVSGDSFANLYLPGAHWRQTLSNGVWGKLGDPKQVPGLDALGGIPIVQFANLHGMGEYEAHLDLLDRINDTTLQRIIGFWYQALRQRALQGDEDDADEDDPEYEEPDFAKLFKASPGALWRIPSDFSIWESQQTDFGPFINAKRDDVKEFAAVTSTPLHLITPDAANGSAEGAGLMRESLTSKVRDRRTRFTPPLKLLWRMAFALSGEQERGRRMRLHWGPIEFRTLAEKASASAQSQGTLSLEDRCEQIWEMSPEDAKRNMTRLAADGLMGLPSGQGGAAAGGGGVGTGR